MADLLYHDVAAVAHIYEYRFKLHLDRAQYLHLDTCTYVVITKTWFTIDYKIFSSSSASFTFSNWVVAGRAVAR